MVVIHAAAATCSGGDKRSMAQRTASVDLTLSPPRSEANKSVELGRFVLGQTQQPVPAQIQSPGERGYFVVRSEAAAGLDFGDDVWADVQVLLPNDGMAELVHGHGRVAGRSGRPQTGANDVARWATLNVALCCALKSSPPGHTETLVG